MSGRYFFDTNAIIYLLRGDKEQIEEFENAEWIGISVLSKIEFLVFPNLSESDKKSFSIFEQRVTVVNIEISNEGLINKTIELRGQFNLKLPDALIAASAIENSATLVTNDKQLRHLSFLQSKSII